MDPFIESQAWQGFHTRYITALGDALVERVDPNYIVDVETYIFVETEDLTRVPPFEPDVFIVESESNAGERASATGLAAKPLTLTLPPMPLRRKQPFLTLRSRDGRQLVTILELLSPTNKKPGDGQTEYRLKRENIIASHVNLVELDFLRGGARLPTREPLPENDYFVNVLRATKFPKVDVYGWSLAEPMPTIAVPLATDDADVEIPLQSVFNLVFDRSGYRNSLNYDSPLVPPLPESRVAWARKLLDSRKLK
jgi:hypothetical protein